MAAFPTEITVKSSEYRPCMVGDKKALFHRWAVDEDALLRFDMLLKYERIQEVRKIIEKEKVVPSGVHVEKLINTYGIVEYEDGTVEAVRPVLIKFLDSGNLFHENALFWRTEENNAQ